ncbi:MAG: hypothetical protein KC912_09290 [Proteobacteria bacterium]|nr:hypothetical protein [Pseudomonadota bacterium]
MTLLSILLSLALAETPAPPAEPTPVAEAAPEAPESAALPTPDELAPWQRSFEGRVTPESPHYDLEVLYFQEKHDEGLAESEKRRAADPSDVDLYWMSARFLFEIGERFERDDTTIDKEAHYQRMIDVAEAGLELAPEHAHLYFARGIGYGRLGTTRGVLASLFMAKDVEKSWVFTAKSDLKYASIGDKEYLPCDAHQALSIYYRLVPDWWIVGVIAGTRGDLQKAMDHGKEAITCAPNLIRGMKEYGVAQVCYGQKKKSPEVLEAGLDTLRAALPLPVRKETDRVDLRHVQMLIDDPSLACEYSRDGQQDLDESKLEK